MKLVIRNARILTLAGGSQLRRGKAMSDIGLIPQGDVRIEAGRIAEVGLSLAVPEGTEVIDAAGRVLMPGFVDCHTHACWAGDPLSDWSRRLEGRAAADAPRKGGAHLDIVAAVRDRTKKQLASALKGRLDQMLREGTTTVEVKSGFGLTAEAELRQLHGIVRAGQEWAGSVVPTALLGAAGEGGAEDFVKQVVRDVLPEVSKEFPSVAVDVICERDAWPVDGCVRLWEKARKHHPVRGQADRWHGMGLVPEAIRLGARSVDHLECTSKDELRALAESWTCAVLLPAASLNADQRFARGGFIVESGGAVALGSDCGPLSTGGHSMPLAIALAVRFCGLSPAEAITAATVNAAAVLDLKDRGTVEVGQRADLLLLRHRDERALAWELGGNPVDLVVCGDRLFSL